MSSDTTACDMEELVMLQLLHGQQIGDYSGLDYAASMSL